MSLTRSRGGVLISAATIVLSASLLFLLEPLIAKQILPWFGGTAAVWTTCLVFYQVALLLGYLYARTLVRIESPARQFAIHALLLLFCLPLLPIGPGSSWASADPKHPFWLIIGMLSVTIGLPFTLLSSTSPLLQYWLAKRTDPSQGAPPYWLFALSNAASLAALFAYPFLVERYFDIVAQRRIWSMLFVCFVVLAVAAAWQQRSIPGMKQNPVTDRSRPDKTRTALWFALAACGSTLLLAFTNHITQNVAAVPLLWVIPLAFYLLTFILAFSQRRLYSRSIWLRILALALAAIAYATWDIRAIEAIQVSLPVFLIGLFAACFFCHGELSSLRPDTEQLTDFYLWIAAGGAAGALFVGLIAPMLFSGIYELPISLMFVAALAVVSTWHESWLLRLVWMAAAAAMAVVLAFNVQGFHHDSLVLERSFYGSLRVVQTPRITEHQSRSLFHGTIKHGEEFLSPALRLRPTTYYGPESGIGILLRDCYPLPKRVGVIGLGAGTIAAYAKPGDTYRFFEINQQVVNIAQALFYFVPQSQGTVQILVGDGRLLLAQQSGPNFDVLALDAFSGDAVPVHLLTAEALALYRKHLTPGGAIAFHVSNNYLDLGAVVGQLARSAGMHAVLIHNQQDDDAGVEAADWVIVTNNDSVLANAAVRLHSVPIAERGGLRPWTDTYNNLLEAFRPVRLTQ